MVFQAQNQQQRAIEHANLQNWLQQQDLTQHEQMRLQQQQNALGYVMNDPNLSDEVPEGGGMSERQRLAFQIKTNIDPLHQRLEQAQVRRQEQVARQAMNENARVVAQQQLDQRLIAAGFPASQSYSLDPTIEQQVRDEMGQYLAPGENLSERDVLQETARRGGVTRYHQHRPGQWEQSGSDRVGAEGQAASGQGGTTSTRAARAPGAPMSEQDFRKELHEVEALVTARMPTHGPASGGEGQRPTSFTDEDRSKLRNRLAREHGLYSEQDYQAGANPTYEHYLDMRTPGRREARARREQVETRSTQEYDRRAQALRNLPAGPERDALELANHRVRDAVHRYGTSMPESVQRGVGRYEQSLQQFEQTHRRPLVGPPTPDEAPRAEQERQLGVIESQVRASGQYDRLRPQLDELRTIWNRSGGFVHLTPQERQRVQQIRVETQRAVQRGSPEPAAPAPAPASTGPNFENTPAIP